MGFVRSSRRVAHRSRLLLTLLACTLAGCAVFERDNRRVLNELDARIQPGSTAARIALAPAAVPVGTVALATDMAVVHPAAMVPRAARDVKELYWKPAPASRLRAVLLFPLKVLATPPTFVADWLGRSLFAVKAEENT
ncbi:MAG: hypothetical protein JXB32_24155 [Deltaproteobacteria bacterium]|nr:hypothetical protein [Deltaproteobacteria bacterium]